MNKDYLKLFSKCLFALPLLLFGINQMISIHPLLNFVFVCVIIVLLVVLGGIAVENSPEDVVGSSGKRFINLIMFIAIICIIPWSGFKTTYNTSVDMTYSYEQKCLERPGFYDMMWKTYSEKKELRRLNEETFMKVASIIMDARKDGPQLAWKWTQENTGIPFKEFSDFYKDLSSYIESKRSEYLALEIQCQQMAYSHNAYIKKFPHNVYNILLGRRYLQYEYGFTSDSTIKVFSTKRE